MIELSLYGGAVFTPVCQSRDSTKVFDAMARPSELPHHLARQVAREQEPAEDWLNSHVGQFLAAREAKRVLTDLDLGPGLRVCVPTVSYLLALKLAANRPPLPAYAGDQEDLRFLLKKMAIRNVDEAERQLRWLPLRDSPLPLKRRNLFLASAEAELPLTLRRGRPRKSRQELRRNNAQRQRRYRERRAQELAMLRRLAGSTGEPTPAQSR